jgi:hypothetical protein
VDAKHLDIRIGPPSAGCAFLRTGYFCAAQAKEFNIATSVQCGFQPSEQVASVLRRDARADDLQPGLLAVGVSF